MAFDADRDERGRPVRPPPMSDDRPGWHTWGGWALSGVLLLTAALLYADRQGKLGEARQLREQNEQLEQVSDSLADRNDSLARAKARADSSARRDSARLAATRDSLEGARHRAEAATGEALDDADTSADAVAATLARLKAKALEVAPDLALVVDTAQAQLAAHERADSAVVAGFEGQIAAQAEMLAAADSLAALNFRRWRRSEDESVRQAQEMDALREQVAGLQAENDKLWSIVDPPLLQQLLGRNLLEGAATLGSGVAAWAYSWKSGVGWTGGQVARVAF